MQYSSLLAQARHTDGYSLAFKLTGEVRSRASLPSRFALDAVQFAPRTQLATALSSKRQKQTRAYAWQTGLSAMALLRCVTGLIRSSSCFLSLTLKCCKPERLYLGFKHPYNGSSGNRGGSGSMWQR